MRSFQASKRTGFMEVELTEGKLQMQGQAVIIFEGRLTIDVQDECRTMGVSRKETLTHRDMYEA